MKKIHIHENLFYVHGLDEFSSVIRLFATPWTAAHQASWSLLKLMSIESAMPSNHLSLCCLLLLLPSIFPSIRVFSSESVLRIRWPKYWSFSFSINPSNEYSGLISFRMDWLDLLAVQGHLKSLLQHHNSNGSILRCSAFFILQLSHPYMTTGKTIALSIWKDTCSLEESYDQSRQHIKKQRHYSANICLCKTMVFPVVMYGCESWTIKKADY